MTRHVICSVLAASTLMVCSPAFAAGTGAGQSSKEAAALVALMKSQGVDVVAAPDPAVPGRLVAAMLIPDVQLLVVAGKSTAPDYVQAQLAQRQFREVYTILNATAVLDSKLFFQDMGCDGLTDGDSGIDIMYERGKNQTIFDGDWKRQKISRADYQAKAEKADDEYGRMLAVLTQSLQAAPAAAGR
jgi:hypothetical protein